VEYMLHLNRKAEIETLASSTKPRLSTSQGSVDGSPDSLVSFVLARIKDIVKGAV